MGNPSFHGEKHSADAENLSYINFYTSVSENLAAVSILCIYGGVFTSIPYKTRNLDQEKQCNGRVDEMVAQQWQNGGLSLNNGDQMQRNGVNYEQ